MTLRRKMAFQIAAMIVGLLLVSAASLWGLNGLQQDYGLALRGYQQQQELFRIGAYLTNARTLLNQPQPNVEQAHIEIGRAELAGKSGEFEATLLSDLDQAQAALDSWSDMPPALRPPLPPTQDINRALSHIGDSTNRIRLAVQANQDAARARRRTTMLAMAVLSAAVVAAALLLGVWQYRGVISPLRRLGEGVRRIAAGRFNERIARTGGADEFARLADDFNRMAAELHGFYHELERKVADKSKELVRSERLASVGMLAAGVAHEINNPLSVITGYAEYSLNSLGKSANGRDDEVRNTLRIVCDEAFRCKEIIGRLLSLARPGDAERRRVNVADAAGQVVSALGGLREYHDRGLAFRDDTAAHREELEVLAVESEVKQVVMNLALNALEAVQSLPTGAGRVDVAASRDGGWVTLTVTDNGRGMSPSTLERVFEPFFTDRPVSTEGAGPRAPGTGLGLSITHAIVEGHGGKVSAHSDGPGKGSRFVVRWPAERDGPAASAAGYEGRPVEGGGG